MKYSGAFTFLLLRSIKMETNYCQGLANSKADKSLGATGPGLIWGSSRAALFEETFGCSHNFCHYAILGIGNRLVVDVPWNPGSGVPDFGTKGNGTSTLL
jgi:hypothetical protein